MENILLKIEAVKSAIMRLEGEGLDTDLLCELLFDLENIKRKQFGWQKINLLKLKLKK